jgi:hypothetical protein
MDSEERQSFLCQIGYQKPSFHSRYWLPEEFMHQSKLIDSVERTVAATDHIDLQD